MRSPKFKFVEPTLRKVFRVSALKSKWRDKVKAQIRRQTFTDLVEFRDIDENLDHYVSEIIGSVFSGKYDPIQPKNFLIEKSRGLRRQMTLVAPRDLLVLQIVSSALHHDIDSKKPSKNAFYQPGDTKISSSHSSSYGVIQSWLNFQKEILSFRSNCEYIVVADVANFYDFIRFEHLRNIIAELCEVEETLLDFLILVLRKMSWSPDYMPNLSVGLPQIEAEAPRVLANAMLYELDKVAEGLAPGNYARFMDDIDVGVNSIREAKSIVRDIDLTLQSRQLRLNGSKTKILRVSSGEVDSHFCVRENRFLDFAENLLKTSKNPNSERIVKSALLRAHGVFAGTSVSHESRYFYGNGEKIFKRLTNLLRKVDGSVDESDLIWIVKNRPSLRGQALFCLSFNLKSNDSFYQISKILYSGVFVDDAAIMYVAEYLVQSRFSLSKRFVREVRSFVDFISSDVYSEFYLYAAILISSKYLSLDQILRLLKRSRDRWSQDYWGARLVAGLQPRFITNASLSAEFNILTGGNVHQEFNNVIDFHVQIQTREEVARKLYKYLKSKNKTYPQGIYHSKAIVALSYYQIIKLRKNMMTVFKNHPALRLDPAYRSWFI